MLRRALLACLLVSLTPLAVRAAPPPADADAQAAALVAEGDRLFENLALTQALATYERVPAAAQSYPYARYKSAWCLFNLGKSSEALARFVDVAHLGQAAAASEGTQRLAREALKDSVSAYALVGKPAEAYRYYGELARASRLDLVERLAERLLDNSRAHDVELALAPLETALAHEPELAAERFRMARYARLRLQAAWQSTDRAWVQAAAKQLPSAWKAARAGADAAAAAATLETEHARLRELVQAILTQCLAEATKTKQPALQAATFETVSTAYREIFPADIAQMPVWPRR